MNVFERSESIVHVVKALTQVQSKIKGASKDATNPHFKSDYATLESVMDAVREPLASAKLAVIQPILNEGNTIAVSTVILHESGEYLACRVPCLYERQTMQAVGSAISYARRYGLMAMLAIPVVDDDGESAVGRGQNVAQPAPQQSQFAGEGERDDRLVTEAQAKMIYAKAKAKKIPDEKLKDILLQVSGVRSTAQVPWGDVNTILNEIASFGSH